MTDDGMEEEEKKWKRYVPSAIPIFEGHNSTIQFKMKISSPFENPFK